ncbi:glucokinase [Sinomonas atrocyanea]|uniref:Glucokinase n=2 Tax=Sinomonas atrocyanea TaxID=37927 RepID=A0A126ZWV5_9MICC|nr:ROK family protein [Sinomonas atrocyanea]AMM31021.1 glucokinase [Sinomonas atrocyanea]GGG55523.1 glucokinase [Sinomonas atrocyanea]
MSAPIPLAIGVDIGGTKVKVCAADLDGRLLAVATHRSRSGRPAQETLAEVLECYREATASAALHAGGPVRAAAVGLATPGVVTEEGIGLVPNNPGMESSVPADVLSTALGVQEVAWANDVKAAAMAEHQWGQLRGTQCGLYINLGTGLSAGAVIEGRPLMGAHGAALEIGYLLPTAPARPAGHRSGSAPLEDLISGRALTRRAAALGVGHIDASEVLALAGRSGPGDAVRPEMRRLAEGAIAELVHAVVNLAVVLDPERISIGGGVATRAASQAFLAPLRTALEEYVPCPPEVFVSSSANELSMLGALLLAYRSMGCAVPAVDMTADAVHEPVAETLEATIA